MADDLANGARHLSLEAPLPLPRKVQRESTVESADQAAGIFDLYGESGLRDSWQSNGTGGTPQRKISGEKGVPEGRIEQLTEPPGSPISWDGPMGAMNNVNGGRLSTSSIAPPITVTPAATPEKRTFAEQRNSIFTSSSSSFPMHPSINRLSPRHPQTETGNSSASTSQISFAGSSQYPGEENDAFHVRSTCKSSDS